MSLSARSAVVPVGLALAVVALACALVGWRAVAADGGPPQDRQARAASTPSTCASCPPGTIRLKLTGPNLTVTLGVPAVDGARLRAPKSAAAIVVRASPSDGKVRVTISDERRPAMTRLEFDIGSTARHEIRTQDLGTDLLPEGSGPIVVSLAE